MKIKGFKDTISWYDKNAEKYSADTNVVSFEDDARVFLELIPNSKVLDAGCGNGRDSTTLASLGATVVGVDLSHGQIEVAKRTRSNIEFLQANFLDLPFPDQSFGGVWAHASLVHLETVLDVKQALLEFGRVLKPKGVIYVYVKEMTGSEETAVVSDSLSNHERFFRYYTIEQIQVLLQESGFEILDISKEKDAHGRDEVSWIKVFARKVN